MDLIILVVTLLVASHASHTFKRIVFALSGNQADISGWMVFFLCAAGNYWIAGLIGTALWPILAGIAVGEELALLTTDAIVRRIEMGGSFRLSVTTSKSDEESNSETDAEPEDSEDADEDGDADDDDDDDEDEDEEYDYESDPDYEDALGDYERLEDLIGGPEWADVRTHVEALIDEDLPELLELRNEIHEDRQEILYRIDGLAERKRSGPVEQALEASRDRLDTLHSQVDDRVEAAKTTLVDLLVIVRERQVNGASETIGRAARLLAETQRENELLLATQREMNQTFPD